MTSNPWETPIAMLNTRCPGTTRNSRTMAAVALLDIMVEKEQQETEKVERGLSRLHVVMSSGSLPSLLVLWRSVEILEAWMPTRFPATPLMTGWKTAMSGNLMMTLLRIFPPILEMTMAARTGVQPL